jgi:hypothetical protein
LNKFVNLILERIYNNFESLRINIKEKDKKIHQLNKDIEEMIKKLENQNIENQESIKEN